MTTLVLAGVAFVGIHVCIAGTRLRDRLVAALGEGPYLGLFSLLSVGTLWWMVQAYRGAPVLPLWPPVPGLRAVAPLVMVVAMGLVVVGLVTPSPTATGGTGVLARDDAARGMLRVTRHPFLCGVALWAALHLLLAGTAAAVAFFGALLLLALIGPRSIDARRRRAFGARWERFAAQTSIVPFAAIAAGRNRLVVGEIGAWRLALAAVAYLAVLLLHGRLFGVPALAL